MSAPPARRVVDVARDASPLQLAAYPRGPPVTVTERKHDIAVVIGGKQITDWTSYSITTSIMDPVDTFNLTMPWSRQAYDLMRPDAPVKVTIDGVVVVDGFVDDRDSPPTEDTIVISGRDRCGRLVQESAPGIEWRGLTLTQIIAKLAAPWFATVTLSNARNRRVLRGKGRLVLAANEPVRVDPRPGGLICEPGMVRWEVIKQLLEQVGMLAWSAGDGTELIVGRPNYDQEPQFRFFRPAPGSARAAEGNASIGVHDSVGDRYSRIVVVGAGPGTTSNYGPVTASRYGEAKVNPATRDGEGTIFTARKVLVINRPVRSTAEARALAAQELRRHAASAQMITVLAPAHGQLVGGTKPTLFCPDTTAYIEDERTGRRGTFQLVTCRYESDRTGGERTSMDLVPTGTELALS